MGAINISELPANPVAAKDRPRRRLAVARASVAIFVGLLLVLELIGRAGVWLAATPTKFEPRRFQEFGQTDPVLWWTLQPGLDVEAQGVRVRTNKLGFRDPRDELPTGTPIVFCLGDSTTYGWRVSASEMYSAVAESLVNEHGEPRVTVVSAGVPGYTSYQCLLQLRERILPLRPAIVCVLASNNECRSRIMGDRDRGRRLAQRRQLDRLLGFSHFWVLLAHGPESLEQSWELEPVVGRVANQPDEYRENLRELIRLAREHGATVVVLNVPIRTRFEPTWKTFDQPSEPVAELLRSARRAAIAGESLETQASLIERAVEQQPNQFAGHWRLGQLYAELGRADEADREFRLARDGDLHPEAAKPSYNRVLAELCEAEAVPLVDVHRLFIESGRRDDELFLDHCHPTAAGQRIIGAALTEQLQRVSGEQMSR